MFNEYDYMDNSSFADPCRGCEDHEPSRECKSKGGCGKTNIKQEDKNDERCVRHNVFYAHMPKEFMDAVETIMKYCQNEDCQEDCNNCPCTLAEIRCGDTEEESGYVKREHVVEVIDEQIVKYNYKTNRLEITERERNSIDRLTKEQIQKDCIGDVYTSKEFLEYVKTKFFTPYDGIGFVHNGYEELDDFDDQDVFSYIQSMSEEEFCEKYPYVCWYNK